MPRLFLALVPPTTALDAVAALPRDPTPGARFVAPSTWHVTLRFLGDCDVADVVGALDGVALPHVTARLGPTVTLLGPTVLVVPVAGVDPLHHAVATATRTIGRRPDARPYRAHLTLARLEEGVRPPLLGHPVSGSFDGDTVHLVASHLRSDVVAHERVHSWTTTR